jgi:hypothetical protein
MITITVYECKYDVVFADDWRHLGYKFPAASHFSIQQHLQFCLLRRHGEVLPIGVGVAISNPHELLDDGYAKRLAFKRAVDHFILSYSVDEMVWYKAYHKRCLTEFRRAYWLATKE